MSSKENNIFRPNIVLFISGALISTFFICLILWTAFTQRHIFTTSDFLICCLLVLPFAWCLKMSLDTWTVRIGKRMISVKRLWSHRWTDINIDNLDKVLFNAGLDGPIIRYKKVTLYLKDNRRINFYSYTGNLSDSLYIALLHQTPILLGDYKKRRIEIEGKIKKRQTNQKWQLLLILIILLENHHMETNKITAHNNSYAQPPTHSPMLRLRIA